MSMAIGRLKIDNGVVSVTSLWADECVYYPVDCEPYTPLTTFTWWHPIGSIGSLEDAAQAADWKDAAHPGQWNKMARTFLNGSKVDWWVLEVVTEPYGPHKQHRVIIATTELPGSRTGLCVGSRGPALETRALLRARFCPAVLQKLWEESRDESFPLRSSSSSHSKQVSNELNLA
jgi:hypothetical protein